MKTQTKVVIVTLVLGLITFLANTNGPLGGFWRPHPEGPTPVGMQLGLLMLLSAIESLVFGLGVSFLLFGYPLLATATTGKKGLTNAAYLSIGWLLTSWWFHDNLHIHNGENLAGLLAIEYGFHFTLMVAGIIIAAFFVEILRQRSKPAPDIAIQG